MALKPCRNASASSVTLACLLLLAGGGCDERRARFETPTVKFDAGGGDGPMGTDANRDIVTIDTAPIVLDVGADVDVAPCATRLTCDNPGGRYCGRIGDGCGGVLECGACPGTQTCGGGGAAAGVCGGGAGCVPITSCTAGTNQYCGMIGNGCGGVLDCGVCANGGACGGGGVPSICGGPPGCVPNTSCTTPGGTLCGKIGNGCGGTLDCPATCANGGTCGTATVGTPNVCSGPPGCVPLTCAAAGGGQYCGTLGDGCGKVLDCTATPCPAGQTCGAVSPNVCAPTPPCTPTACDQPTGKYCGMIGDGCGGTKDCAGCAGADTCGGSGLANICGNPSGACVNLCLRQMACAGGAKTSISGTVLTPTKPAFGAPDPIYNALVYVPNAPVTAFPAGVACEACGQASGSPLVWVNSGADGKFKLDNVPVGANIPLVIQVGRWRRQIVISNVTPCVDNPLTAEQTRMPRNKTEGDIPLMAFTTGGADPLECLLRKVGIDDSEFTLPGGTGRVHMYGGRASNGSQLGSRFAPALGGAVFPNATTLWDSPAELAKYDVVLTACEGIGVGSGAYLTNKSVAARQNMLNYTNLGGRLFAEHWNNSWLARGPAPWPTTANFTPAEERDLQSPVTAKIDTSYAKGAALADWLVLVGASAVRGDVVIRAAQHSVNTVNAALAQRWIYADNVLNDQGGAVANSTQYFTFNTPLGVPEANQCGRVVFSDIHVSCPDGACPMPRDQVGGAFPNNCLSTTFTPQEKVLEFMLFDIANCVQTMPPPPPPAPPARPPVTPPPPPAAPPGQPPAPPLAPPAVPPPPPIIP